MSTTAESCNTLNSQKVSSNLESSSKDHDQEKQRASEAVTPVAHSSRELTIHTSEMQQNINEVESFSESSHSYHSQSESRLTSALTTSQEDKGNAINPTDSRTHLPEKSHSSSNNDSNAQMQMVAKEESRKQTLEKSGNLNMSASAEEQEDHVFQKSNNFDNFADRKSISTEQLIQFVTTRVPSNKRVFCLIVRDKISRLNKAKSYFYPTYYLFIQAIVDIDETGDQVLYHNAEDEYNNINGDISTNVSNSNDNSFSASSSISADMLFIGANNSNGTQNSTNNVKHLQGNSYSDNEAYIDTEVEDDYHVDEMTIHKRSALEKNLGLKSTISLQGRDSPLIFPNLDNQSNSNANNNERCTISESGSLTAWSGARDVLNDATDITESRRQSKLTMSNISKTDRQILSEVDCQIKQTRIRENELSIEDSNEEAEDLDDDSDNDEFNCKPMIDEPKSSSVGRIGKSCWEKKPERGEEVDYDDIHQSLFDNERNPYTGTYGVLLAGRKRKKAKT